MKKILIVDDSIDILDLLTLLFDLEGGYIVKAINNGYEIDKVITEFKPDLILLDIMLGLLDGRKICMELKNSSLTSNIPVIMISASHDLNSLSQKNCHANDFIAKPFEIDDLLAKVSFQLAS